jgi:hypothetical protein
MIEYNSEPSGCNAHEGAGLQKPHLGKSEVHVVCAGHLEGVHHLSLRRRDWGIHRGT